MSLRSRVFARAVANSTNQLNIRIVPPNIRSNCYNKYSNEYLNVPPRVLRLFLACTGIPDDLADVSRLERTADSVIQSYRAKQWESYHCLVLT